MENQKGIANIIENDQPISLTYRTWKGTLLHNDS